MGGRSRSRSYLQAYTNPDMLQPHFGALALPGTTYSGFRSVTESMEDVVTPLWSWKRNSGAIINNNMHHLSNTTVLPTFYGYLDGKYASAVGNMTTTTSFSATPTLPPIDSGLVDATITEAYAKVNVRDFDLTVMVAEFGETIALLHDIGKRFLKVYRAVKKLNLRALAGLISPKEYRELWLQYRYGIRPLYYDLKGLYTFMNREELAPRYTVRASSSVPVENAYTSGSNMIYVPTASSNSLALRAYWRRWTETKFTVRAGVLYNVAFSTELAKKLALLGVDRPMSSAWDLIPYSFIVDWFIGIGPFIASWEPKPGCNRLASWSVITQEFWEKLRFTSLVPYYPGNWYGYQTTPLSDGYRHVKEVTRYANPSTPVLPSINVKLNAAKLLDLAALFLKQK